MKRKEINAMKSEGKTSGEEVKEPETCYPVIKNISKR
jgi:hypothetical protein